MSVWFSIKTRPRDRKLTCLSKILSSSPITYIKFMKNIFPNECVYKNVVIPPYSPIQIQTPHWQHFVMMTQLPT